MAVDLLTRDQIESFILITQCCVVERLYKAITAKQFGKGNWKCEYNKAQYLIGAICVMKHYYPDGTVLEAEEDGTPIWTKTSEDDINCVTTEQFNLVVERVRNICC